MSTQDSRPPAHAGGRIDRTASWRFTVDGVEYTGHPGDTIASALIANGRVRIGDSIYRGRPRGILAAGGEEPNALVKVPRPRPLPSLLPATAARSPTAFPPTRSPVWACSTPSRTGDVRQEVRPHRRPGDRRRSRRPRRGPSPPHAPAPVSSSWTSSPSSVARCCPAAHEQRRRQARRRTWVADVAAELAAGGGGHGAHPHGRLRLLRRQLRARRRGPAGSCPPRSPPASRASASGTSGPARWSWPTAPTSARWSSPATTSPASCSPAPSAPTSTGTP